MKKNIEHVSKRTIEKVFHTARNFECANSFHVVLKGYEINFIMHESQNIAIEKMGYNYDSYISFNNSLKLYKNDEITKEFFIKYVCDKINSHLEEKNDVINEQQEKMLSYIQERLKEKYSNCDECIINDYYDAFHLVEELQSKNCFSFITIDNEDKEIILTNIMYNKDKEIFELLEMSSKTSEFEFKSKCKHECIEYIYKHKDKIKKSSCILI